MIVTADSTATVDSASITADGYSGSVSYTNAWPDALPLPKFGMGVNPADQTIRTDMEVGAARARRRTHARIYQVQVSWLFSDAQFVIFQDWFDQGAQGGAAWFSLRLPLGGRLSAQEVRFIGPVQITNDEGMNWSVSGKLEVRFSAPPAGAMTADSTLTVDSSVSVNA